MILNANALHIPLADKSVQMCVTSPPYYGLRDYKVAGQLGLEKTPDEYIANMVCVFREVWRVMADTGTLWLNISDSYATEAYKPWGIKPKDEMDIPHYLKIALKKDGWYARSTIIWHKPNPMPESVTDRPTKAHEYLFLLSKSARYYYDNEAVKEPGQQTTIDRAKGGTWNNMDIRPDIGFPGAPNRNKAAINRDVREKVLSGEELRVNKRSVWTIATQPTKEAHFATYPEKLVEPCILAGTSARGCCPECGVPWVHDIERKANYEKRQARGQPEYKGAQVDSSGWKPADITDNGWQPSCPCDAGDAVPCTVLDPFSGSGTTGRVAIRLGRRYVGLELNWTYITEISRKRTTVQMGMGL